MASFHGTLHLDGQQYPLEHCSYEFAQSTDPRGRATTKVQGGTLTLTLVVPDDDALLAWAADPHKKLNGRLTFNGIDQAVTHEEVSFEQGFCVAYEEVFAPGTGTGPSSYFCTLQIAAGTLSLGEATKDHRWAQSR
jgi:hypothetical protein